MNNKVEKEVNKIDKVEKVDETKVEKVYSLQLTEKEVAMLQEGLNIASKSVGLVDVNMQIFLINTLVKVNSLKLK